MRHEEFNWREEFTHYDAIPDTASAAEKQARGRALEQILYSAFSECGYKPQTSYRPKGEEIDGSFWYHGRTILIEAKWTSAPLPASSVYQFKGKVDGKLVGTIGVFISIGGFSQDSVDALVAGKDVNIVLFDGHDIRALVYNKLTMDLALEHKLRAAGNSGTPFIPFVGTDDIESTLNLEPQRAARDLHIVVVEGNAEIIYFESIQRIFEVDSDIRFRAAGGPMNILPLVESLVDISDRITRVDIVIGADIPRNVVNTLKAGLTELNEQHTATFNLIKLEPEIDVALGLTDPDTPYRERWHIRRAQWEADKIENTLRNANLLSRADKNEQISSLLQILGAIPK